VGHHYPETGGLLSAGEHAASTGVGLQADASTLTGTIIGGRLDYARFSAAAERLMPALLAEPIPYPPSAA